MGRFLMMGIVGEMGMMGMMGMMGEMGEMNEMGRSPLDNELGTVPVHISF